MTRRDRLREEYEDALFALLMEEVAEQEGKRLLEENERLKHDPDAAVPDEVSQRCRKAIKRSFAREQRHETGRFVGRTLSKVSLVVMIAILLFVTAYAAVPQIRINTLNFLIEVSDVATGLRLVSDESIPTAEDDNATASAMPEMLWGYRLPEIPEEFTLEFQSDTDQAATLWYSDGAGATIIFEIYEAGNSDFNVDTEDADVEKILIHGYQGLFIEEEDWINIVWGDTNRGNFVSISCTNLSRDVVLGYANEMNYQG